MVVREVEEVDLQVAEEEGMEVPEDHKHMVELE